MIQSQITHSGYSAEPMTLSHVDVLGVDRQPASVQVNGQAYTKFTYTGKVMYIERKMLKDLNEKHHK